jgi:tetratricopeptide (TPR) repeat protein
MPARYALERKDWTTAASLQPEPSDFPWDKFPWEKANIYFARVLGAVHTNKVNDARKDLEQLKALHTTLVQAKENYKSNLVLIQVKASEAWIKLAEGKKDEALALMTEASDMEDATAKHPVTPGEIIPARELLGDMYLQTGNPQRALQVYEQDLKRHPNRFNGIYGATLAAQKSGEAAKARQFLEQLTALGGKGNKRVLMVGM